MCYEINFLDFKAVTIEIGEELKDRNGFLNLQYLLDDN
jgi:hypothetical protein